MSETPLIDRVESSGGARSRQIGSGSVSGDTYSPTLTTAGSRATGKGVNTGHLASRRQEQARKGPACAAVHSCRLLIDAAREDLSDAISEDDLILRSNSIDAVRQSLMRLWAMRKQREDPFGDVVNDLQTFLDEKPDEDLPTTQLIALDGALQKLAEEPMVDDYLATNITLSLMRGGVNVFQDLD